MNVENYTKAVRPKIPGSWNLHYIFNHADIDFFVMLSSLAGVAGTVSQANYAAATHTKTHLQDTASTTAYTAQPSTTASLKTSGTSSTTKINSNACASKASTSWTKKTSSRPSSPPSPPRRAIRCCWAPMEPISTSQRTHASGPFHADPRILLQIQLSRPSPATWGLQ